jgi:hypothetical protein
VAVRETLDHPQRQALLGQRDQYLNEVPLQRDQVDADEVVRDLRVGGGEPVEVRDDAGPRAVPRRGW